MALEEEDAVSGAGVMRTLCTNLGSWWDNRPCPGKSIAVDSNLKRRENQACRPKVMPCEPDPFLGSSGMIPSKMVALSSQL